MADLEGYLHRDAHLYMYTNEKIRIASTNWRVFRQMFELEMQRRDESVMNKKLYSYRTGTERSK
ncbi:MAG: hypothetical protein PHQ59_03000 [Candidatus Daviesbacteria bacterium]|nr:hypothetical protein [Candidatus Daviesbacteria bacterium]